MTEYILAPGVLDAMLAHARETLPHECCGLIIGENGRFIEAIRARNVHASPTRYQVDPRDHFAAIREARRRGLRVVAAYHSHPATPPVPSETDLAEALDENLVYVIVTPGRAERGGQVRAWRIVERNFQEVTLVPQS